MPMNEATPIDDRDRCTTLPAARTSRRSRGRIGVLIVNLGTPDATDDWSMRRYLKEFLSDPRVIENQGPLWWLVLNGIILPIRPRPQGARLRQDLEPRARTNRR